MTGFEIYRRAMSLLGYTNSSGEISDSSGLLNRVSDALQHICIDLNLMAPKTLSQELLLDQKQCDAVVCGVAMLLSLGQGDAELNRIFTSLYNAKRGHIKGKNSNINDVLPTLNGGV